MQAHQRNEIYQSGNIARIRERIIMAKSKNTVLMCMPCLKKRNLPHNIYISWGDCQDCNEYGAKYEIPAIYHDLGDQPTFQSLYAHLFFDSPAHAARHPYLRLYLIEETDTVNARDVSLGAASDDGIPIIEEEPDNCQLTFFFAAIKDD